MRVLHLFVLALPLLHGLRAPRQRGLRLGSSRAAALAGVRRCAGARLRATPSMSLSENSRRSVVRNAALAALLSMGQPIAATAAAAGPRDAAYANGFRALGEVEKSPLDDREYGAIELANGLRVLLVSDMNSDSAACAMNVHVGHLSDPAAIPGLAHFCEHMLFLGTKGYPEEQEFNRFLNLNGGSSNAFTATEDTNYFFSIDPRALDAALDRFSRFFYEPLFTASATGRELNAIDSEHRKNLQNDGFRQYQLLKSFANPEHPFSKFGTGNLQTLQKDAFDIPEDLRRPAAGGTRRMTLREALIAFFDEYYRPRGMTLCMVAPQPLKAMRAMAVKHFGALPTEAYVPPEASWDDVCAFPRGSAAPGADVVEETRVVPAGSLRRLSVAWPFCMKDAAAKEAMRTLKPEYYVTWLLGHEGEGSVLYNLRRQGLCNGLASDISEDLSDLKMLSVSVDLTERGLRPEGRTAILRTIFAYLDRVRRDGVPQYLFDEIQSLNGLAWQFLEKGDAESYASGLAGNMQDYDAQRYVSGPILLRRDAGTNAAVASLLAAMTPQNAQYTFTAPEAEAPLRGPVLTERIYGTRYVTAQSPLARIAASAADADAAALSLPAPNKYLPRDLSLRDPPRPKPRRAAPPDALPAPPGAAGAWALYHKQDRYFKRPRAYLVMQVDARGVEASYETYAAAKIWSVALADAAAAEQYPAALAGLSGDLELSGRGVRFSASGYSDRLSEYASDLMDLCCAFRGPEGDGFESAEEKLERYRDLVLRELKAYDTQQPYAHAAFQAQRTCEFPRFDNARTRAAVKAVTMAEVQAVRAAMWSGSGGRALLQGNLRRAEAEQLLARLVGKVEETQASVRAGAPDGKALFRYGDGEFEALAAMPFMARPRRVTKALPAAPRGLGSVLQLREPNAENDNSAVHVQFQVPNPSDRERAALELLSSAIEEPFYDDLRTKQQLGYLVFSGVKEQERNGALVFVVQSAVRDPLYLTDAVFGFVAAFGETLRTIPPEQWRSIAESLARRKTEPEKRLAQEVNRFWTEIQLEPSRFERAFEEAEALKRVAEDTVAGGGVLKLWDEAVGEGGARRRLLVSQVFCKKDAGKMDAPLSSGQKVADVDAFRRTLQYTEEAFPDAGAWV